MEQAPARNVLVTLCWDVRPSLQYYARFEDDLQEIRGQNFDLVFWQVMLVTHACISKQTRFCCRVSFVMLEQVLATSTVPL